MCAIYLTLILFQDLYVLCSAKSYTSHHYSDWYFLNILFKQRIFQHNDHMCAVFKGQCVRKSVLDEKLPPLHVLSLSYLRIVRDRLSLAYTRIVRNLV